MRITISIIIIFVLSYSAQCQQLQFSKDREAIEGLMLEFRMFDALRFSDSCITNGKKTYTPYEMGLMKSFRAEALVRTQQYDMALEYSQNLLRRYKSPDIRMRLRLSRALSYECLTRLDKCKLELEAGEKLIPELVNADLEAEFYIRCASYFRFAGDRPEFIKYAEKANQKSKDIEYWSGVAVSGLLLAMVSEGEDSERYLQQSLRFWVKCGDKVGASAMYYNLGAMRFGASKFEEAHKYCDSSIYLAQMVDDFNELSGATQLKSLLFEKQGKLDSALVYLNKHVKYSKENVIFTEREANQRREYQREQEQKDVVIQKKQKEIRRVKQEKTRLLLYISALIALVILTLFLGYRLYRSRRKVIVQNAKLNQFVQTKEVLLKEVNHRTKNNLMLVLSMMDHQLSDSGNAEVKTEIEKLKARVNSVALAHQALISDWEGKDVLDEILIREYIHRIAAPYSAMRDMDCVVNIDPELQSNIKLSVPLGILVNEMFSNSVKHAVPPETELLRIELTIEFRQGEYSVDYKDNGTKDFPEKPSGLGTYIIASMTRQLRAKMIRKRGAYTMTFNPTGNK